MCFSIVVVQCCGLPKSKIIKEVCLSTTEAEYAALSESLKNTKFLQQLMKESRRVMGWQVTNRHQIVHCKAFRQDIADLTNGCNIHYRVLEDNSGAYEMARLPKMRPRTRHLNVKLHHFREYVRLGRISNHKVSTDQQLAGIATKAQPLELFEWQRKSLMQWDAETMTKEELQQPLQHLRACDI